MNEINSRVIDRRRSRTEGRIYELEDRIFEIIQSENTGKTMDKEAYMIYGLPSKGAICHLLVLQRKGRRRREQKTCLDK